MYFLNTLCCSELFFVCTFSPVEETVDRFFAKKNVDEKTLRRRNILPST